jgi:hypothetical protein
VISREKVEVLWRSRGRELKRDSETLLAAFSRNHIRHACRIVNCSYNHCGTADDIITCSMKDGLVPRERTNGITSFVDKVEIMEICDYDSAKV